MYLASVAAGVAPAVEGGVSPPRILRPRTRFPPGKMPGSTAGETPAATCESEVMTITGESPSPMMMWKQREPEGDCAAERRGGKQPEGSSQAQRRQRTGVEPGSAGGRRRAYVAKAKPGPKGSCEVARKHIRVPTSHSPNVLGVSMRMRLRHGLRNEICAGAVRERCRSQSRHSSAGAW